ncbi:MAG: phage shock protein A [Nonlabens sp.]
MNIFKNILKIGEAQANKTGNNLESSIIMAEQGIHDMKASLNKSVEAIAQIKALAIGSRKERDEQEAKAKDYESKATLILIKSQAGDMVVTDADSLAKEALAKKEEAQQHANRANADNKKFDKNISELKNTIETIKGNFTNWENNLKTLKARVKVSDATKNVNKQMAELDSAETVSMLERMKEKASQDEAPNEASGELTHTKKSIDDEINAAADTTEAKIDDDLAKLKEQLGMKKDDA